VTTGAVVAGIIGAVVAVPIMAVVNAAVPIIRSDAQARGSPPAREAGRSELLPPG
jgi:predicted PurR-regulated permease PerM